MTVQNAAAPDYDSVELRGGRLHKIRRSEARMLAEEDRMVPVAKCYCRSHDVLTAEEVELQRRPTFVFPVQFFGDLESLIGKELEGRIYADSRGRRVKFHLNLSEHAGFQFDEADRNLHSPGMTIACSKSSVAVSRDAGRPCATAEVFCTDRSGMPHLRTLVLYRRWPAASRSKGLLYLVLSDTLARPAPLWRQECSTKFAMDELHRLAADIARHYLVSQHRPAPEESRLFEDVQQFALEALQTVRSRRDGPWLAGEMRGYWPIMRPYSNQ